MRAHEFEILTSSEESVDEWYKLARQGEVRHVHASKPRCFIAVEVTVKGGGKMSR